MKRLATLTILLLLTMLLLAGTASATVVSGVYDGVYGGGWDPDLANGWSNSNRSGETGTSVYGEVYLGFAPLIRSVPGQLTHTAFQLNTNSCASCHMTHTAIGPNLLIRSTTSATCSACHDGTMGFLNVNARATGTTSDAGMGGSVAAGTFGVDNERTSSMHSVGGTMTISGAPGGRRTQIPATGAESTWNANFTCASCHAPHGSHSIRLLHLNPNNIAGRDVASSIYGVDGGRRIPRAGAPGFTVDNVTWNVARGVYLYDEVHAAAYTAPWVSGTVSIFHDTLHTGTLLTAHFTVNLATGEVMQTAAQRTALRAALMATPFFLSAADANTAPLNINVGRGLQVRAQARAEHLGDLVGGAREIDFLDPSSYDAPAYNLFCAACHTDYLPTTAAGDQPDGGAGINSQKYRHTINRYASSAVSPMPVRGGTGFIGANLTGSTDGSNQLMCLSCHFAHGTDASMMLFANNTRVSAGTATVTDATYAGQNDVSAQLGGSSALKRYINQASCWHCHVSSRSAVFQNTDYYWQTFNLGLTW